MYITETSYDERECLLEYVKHKNEVPDLNTFREMYLMETIDELNYFAIDTFEHFFEKIIEEHRQNLSNEKKLRSLIDQLCPVRIFLGDHDWMEIHFRDQNIQKSLLDIISKYSIM